MENNNSVLLEMKNICKSFPGVKALDNVSLTVKRGTVHALMGENGAGKSTLMKCLFQYDHLLSWPDRFPLPGVFPKRNTHKHSAPVAGFCSTCSGIQLNDRIFTVIFS